MPTYEYKCPSCKKSYEIRESFSAEATHTSQECGKGTAKRVIHAPRVVFKGSGFYSTDSRGTKSAMPDRAGAGETAAETKADAKPATKPAAIPAATSGGDSKPEPAAAN